MYKQRRHNPVWNGYETLRDAANAYAAEIANDVKLNKHGIYQEEFMLQELPELFCFITFYKDSSESMVWKVDIGLTFYGL